MKIYNCVNGMEVMMVDQSTVDQYLIGGLDAWGETEQEYLRYTFLYVRQYAQVEERERCFLCGRRGSGKSAIAIMLKQSPLWDRHVIFQGEASQYGAYMELVDDLAERKAAGLRIDVKRCVQLLWTYVLRIMILKSIVESAYELGLSDDPDIMKAKTFLMDENFLHRSIGDALHDVFGTSMSFLKEDGTRGVAEFYAALRNRTSVSEFRQLVAAIPSMLGRKRILLVIDTIESYKIYDESMKEGLAGVIAAISGILTAPDLNGVGIRFFLPGEVYEDVSKEMPAKIGGRTVFLRWLSGDLFTMLSMRFLAMLERIQLIPTYQLLNLRELVTRGINKTIGKSDGHTLRNEFWYKEGFLPRTVVNRQGWQEDCFAYILRHTQRRPRELIFVLNQIIRRALEQAEMPYISEQSVVSALHSTATQQTLVSDALSPYEGYVSDILDRARAAFQNKPRIMIGSDLRRFAKAFHDLGPVPGVKEDDFVKLLLRSGVVGLIKQGGGNLKPAPGRYRVAEFEYLMQDHVALNNELWYCVHPILGDFFEMEINETDGIVYPKPEDDQWLEEELGIVE